MLPDPRQFLPRPVSERDCRWLVAPELRVLEGVVYLGGSCSHPTDAARRRAAWAAVTLSDRGRVTAAIGGALCWCLQHIGVAELWAAIEVLTVSLGAVELVTDCQMVATGFARGRQATCRSSVKYADVWTVFWAAVE